MKGLQHLRYHRVPNISHPKRKSFEIRVPPLSTPGIDLNILRRRRYRISGTANSDNFSESDFSISGVYEGEGGNVLYKSPPPSKKKTENPKFPRGCTQNQSQGYHLSETRGGRDKEFDISEML